MFVAKKTRRNFGSTKWCIVCTPKPDLTTGTSRQRNRVKPPRNLVFGAKQVDWECLLRKNKTQLRKHKVVHCMHPKTRSHNGYLPATESRETTQKLSFGPQEMDWPCLLRKNKTTSEAQSGALYAPQNPISQQVPPGNRIARNHVET